MRKKYSYYFKIYILNYSIFSLLHVHPLSLFSLSFLSLDSLSLSLYLIDFSLLPNCLHIFWLFLISLLSPSSRSPLFPTAFSVLSYTFSIVHLSYHFLYLISLFRFFLSYHFFFLSSSITTFSLLLRSHHILSPTFLIDLLLFQYQLKHKANKVIALEPIFGKAPKILFPFVFVLRCSI